MSGGELRRVALTGVAYLAVALLVLSVAGWARVVLALPATFPRMLRLIMGAGFLFALLIAWHYPKIGHHGVVPDEDEGE